MNLSLKTHLSFWIFTILATIVLLFSACNLFNPLGNRNPDNSNTEELLIEGVYYFQNQNYSKAQKTFNRVIYLDSTNSEAWLGLVKSTFYSYDLNPFELASVFLHFESEKPNMFMSDSLSLKYKEGVDETFLIVAELIRRDTLSTLYKKYLEHIRKKAPLDLSLEKFEKENKKNLDKFPLSDQKITFQNLSLGFGVLATAKTLLHLKTNAIDKYSKLFTNPETNEFDFDLDRIYNSFQDDPSSLDSLTEVLIEIADDVETLNNVVLPLILEWGVLENINSQDELLNVQDQKDTEKMIQEISDNLDEFKNYLLTYQNKNDTDEDSSKTIFESILHEFEGGEQ